MAVLQLMRIFVGLLVLTIAASAQKAPDTITVIGVGDIMLGTSYPEGYLPPNDGRALLEPVEKELQAANITFGNCEGTLFDGVGVMKQCRDSTKCFAFKSPERYALYLKKAGFDFMSVANNHSGDFGEEGRRRTIDVLRSAGIAASGTLTQPFVVLQKSGVKYGLASFAPNVGTQSLHNYKAARRIVKFLDSVCDVVIVSFHGGGEGLAYQHVPRTKELFVGEDRGDVYAFARVAIDAGADIVFGHGPHVPRAIDLYKNRFIAYSLGNFATYGRFSLKGEAGLAPIVNVQVDKDGKFLGARIIAAKQVGEGGPVPDKSGAVIEVMRTLTKTDFPRSLLTISESGIVRKRKIELEKKQQRLKKV